MSASPEKPAPQPATPIGTNANANTPRAPENVYHTAKAVPAFDESYILSLVAVRKIVYLQLFLEIFFLIVSYTSWWGIVMSRFAVPCIGFYATMQPMDRTRRKWIAIYYYGSILTFMVKVLLASSLFVLMIWHSHDHPSHGLSGYMKVISITALHSIVYYIGAKKTKVLRTQFDRCVPPSNPIVLVTTV